MTLSNPLNISLCIENLSLTFIFDKGLTFIEPQVLDELLLAPSSTTQVILLIISVFYIICQLFYMRTGYSRFKSKKCRYSNHNWCSVQFTDSICCE